MLLEKIKADALTARKAREADKSALLTTLYADAARLGKDAGGRESTDEEVIRTVRKFLKWVDESLALITQLAARACAEFEKALLEGYLPKQVTGPELQAVIASIAAGLPDLQPRQMGAVMKVLRERLAGAYDGAEASALVKATLVG